MSQRDRNPSCLISARLPGARLVGKQSVSEGRENDLISVISLTDRYDMRRLSNRVHICELSLIVIYRDDPKGGPQVS